jgi:hypothetical protein
VVDGHCFGHLVKALTDFEVVPYRLRSLPERLLGMGVECILGRTLSDQRTDGCCTPKTASRRTRRWTLVDPVPEDTAQQMLDLRKNLQKEVQERLGRASSNLSAGSPFVVRP